MSQKSALPVPASALVELAEQHDELPAGGHDLPVAPAQRLGRPPAVLDQPRLAHRLDRAAVDAERLPARVRADDSGRPQQIGGRAVEAVRESWLVEDRWWTEAPLRRRYWEVVTADGRDLVVFRDLEAGRWFAQR